MTRWKTMEKKKKKVCLFVWVDYFHMSLSHMQRQYDAPPHSLKDSNASPKMKTMKKGVGVCSLVRNISGVEGCVGAPRWGLRWVTNELIIHTNLHKPNNKFVSVWLEHFWCTCEPQAYMDSQASSWPKLEGSHQLSPYSIIYD
jgi:hypothetical protein